MSNPTYDSNGYISGGVPLPDMSAPNPWSAMAQQSQGSVNTAANAASNIPQYQQGVADKQSAMNSYGQSTATPQVGYPALPNDYGLGMSKDNSQSAPQSSNGFNPWSLQGEALSR